MVVEGTSGCWCDETDFFVTLVTMRLKLGSLGGAV